MRRKTIRNSPKVDEPDLTAQTAQIVHREAVRMTIENRPPGKKGDDLLLHDPLLVTPNLHLTGVVVREAVAVGAQVEIVMGGVRRVLHHDGMMTVTVAAAREVAKRRRSK